MMFTSRGIGDEFHHVFLCHMAVAQWRQMRQMPHFWKQIKSFFSQNLS